MVPSKSAPDFQKQYAEVNGVRLHYVSVGSGPLIIFLHGFPQFWYQWKSQLALFGQDHLAVAPDMRGYNLSSKPAEVGLYHLKYLIEDVRALADHLGYKQFTLVGHDWGGAVAWTLATFHPDCLHKLVIVNAPHPIVFTRLLKEDPTQQLASQYITLFRSPQAEAILSANHYASLVETAFGPGLTSGAFSENDKSAYIQAWSQPGALTGALNYYRAADFTNLADHPASFLVPVPTLVIWGEKDATLVTGNLDGLPQFVPNLTIKRIPDGTHWVIHERPDQVNGYIRDFVRIDENTR